MTPTYASDYVADRSRLSTFFRLLLIIPHYVLLYFWGILAGVAVVIAWFALLLTARYPRPLYDFVAGYARCSAAFYGFYFLLTDVFPPFGGDTDGYPVRLQLGARPERYSRLKTLVRIVLLIPVAIIGWLLGLVSGVGAILAWFAIVVLGRQPEGLQKLIDLGVGYHVRSSAYVLLLSEAFPPFENPPSGAAAAV